MIAFRDLFEKVVFVALRRQVKVHLSPLQGTDIALYLILIGAGRVHKGDHKRGVDHAAETLLFEEVALRSPHIDGGHFAGQAQIDSVPGRSGKFELNVLRCQKHLKGLLGRVVAARVIADGNILSGQVFGGCNIGVRRHQNRAIGNRVSFAPNAPVFNFSGLIDRPVTGTTNVSGFSAFAALTRLVTLIGPG